MRTRKDRGSQKLQVCRHSRKSCLPQRSEDTSGPPPRSRVGQDQTPSSAGSKAKGVFLPRAGGSPSPGGGRCLSHGGEDSADSTLSSHGFTDGRPPPPETLPPAVGEACPTATDTQGPRRVSCPLPAGVTGRSRAGGKGEAAVRAQSERRQAFPQPPQEASLGATQAHWSCATGAVSIPLWASVRSCVKWGCWTSSRPVPSALAGPCLGLRSASLCLLIPASRGVSAGAPSLPRGSPDTMQQHGEYGTKR